MSKKRSKSGQSQVKVGGVGRGVQKGTEGKPLRSKKSGGGLLPSPAACREIVESVVIAFVLAFLFRTFEAEAFVIPTGSMAPTLLGRHKDVECPECKYEFRVSASDEVNNVTGADTGDRVVSCTCPMCRRTIDLSPGNPEGERYPSYKGDRILVVKFPYQFGDPQRWDIAVFKYPGGAKTNFIKRMVGLPNETIAVSHGDVFVKPAEEEDFSRFSDPLGYHDPPIRLEEFQIARKPPRKIRAMLQLVYDNDYVVPKIIEAGWPARWDRRNEVAGGWTMSEDYRSFRCDGSARGEAWIDYRHFVPSHDDWEHLQHGSMPAENLEPAPQLISDLSGYNAKGTRSDFGAGLSIPLPSRLGLHWVGDLAVECEVEVESQSGEVLLELVEGGRVFVCRIDVASGKATLEIPGLAGFHPTAETDVCGPGTYEIMFSNIDDQLLLWVEGSVVEFDTDTTYPRLGNTRPRKEDLRPVRIGSRGAALRVSQLKLYRDIYYIALRGNSSPQSMTDFKDRPYGFSHRDPTGKADRQELVRVLSRPEAWGAFEEVHQIAFPLKEDQFLMLGDNSSESKDSRLWEDPHRGVAYYVSRKLLIGKALFIYWPHAFDRIPGTEIRCDLPIPFTKIRTGFPNFWRMCFVR